MSISLFPVVAALVVVLSILPVGAAEPAKPAKPAKPPVTQAKPPAKTPLMTRAELRDCMARKDKGRAETAELTTEQDQINAEKTALVAQGETLKQELAAVDRTSAEAVAQYNERARARDAAIEALATRTTAFNTRVEAANATRSTYSAACENRRYDELDEIAIRNGK